MLRRLSLPLNISIDIGRSLHWNPVLPRTTPASPQTVAWSSPDALWSLSGSPLRSQQQSDSVDMSEPCSSQPDASASSSSSSGGGIRGGRRSPGLRPPRLPKGLSKLHLQVMQTIRSRELIQPKSSILIAVSGGQVRTVADQ